MNIVHASVKAHWGPDLAIKKGILSPSKRSTFMRRRKELLRPSPQIIDNRRLLLPLEEERIVLFVLKRQRLGLPVTRLELKETAQCLVEAQAELRRGLPMKDRASVRMTKCAKARVHATHSTLVSNDWVTGFLARHPELKLRTARVLDTKRVQAATQETCDRHFERLQETLLHFNLLDRHKRLKPEARLRIGNVDEVPGNQKGSRNVKALGHKGVPIFIVGQDRIENVTYTPIALLGGDMLVHQFILKEAGAVKSNSHMFPLLESDFDSINYLLNWTDNGFQTGLTYLELLKQLVIELDKPGINHTKSKPFVLLTDGHTSRPTFPVHGFCELNNIQYGHGLFHHNTIQVPLIACSHLVHMLVLDLLLVEHMLSAVVAFFFVCVRSIRHYLFPSHTTQIFQPLDRMFDMFHTRFGKEVAAWRRQALPSSSTSLRQLPSCCTASEGDTSRINQIQRHGHHQLLRYMWYPC
eukprot:m.348130 g.348130  ORF g.348130 m.348130 type:complete len:468 (-) comp16147_c0_seq17:620-2023(-)